MNEHENIIKGLVAVRQLLVAMEAASVGRTPLIENIETVNSAIALLKAQEPVEPVVDKNTSTGECEDPWGRLFFCGACGKRINEKYDPDEDDKYCKHCGRAVKWG